MDYCETYCTHGGVCERPAGHKGQHDSGYCQWSDAESIGRDEANRRLATKPGGALMETLWEATVPRADDPPEYDDDAEAQRIAEVYADAADEMAAAEAEGLQMP